MYVFLIRNKGPFKLREMSLELTNPKINRDQAARLTANGTFMKMFLERIAGSGRDLDERILQTGPTLRSSTVNKSK